MNSYISMDRLTFFLNRFRERLWVKPFAVCLLSIAAAFLAKLADGTSLVLFVPVIAGESIETLLSIMASSMLVIATFSVGSMVSAYASASNTATPRSFTLVVADDASQNALSTFVGVFIYSIVALIAVKNDYFQVAGIFILFILTVIAFGLVIFTFVRWVDNIARLGRMGSIIEKVENATASALMQRCENPTLCGVAVRSMAGGQAVFAAKVGYVQHINVADLQLWAEQEKVRVVIAALPGTFASAGRPLAFVHYHSHVHRPKTDCQPVRDSFKIGNVRLFTEDPRFGLVVLSEIGSRALSPAVNDPGTAICVIGTLLRLFTLWADSSAGGGKQSPIYDRVEVPELSLKDMFDDAFTAIARDGSGIVEVAIRLQKALHSLAQTEDRKMQEAAIYHGRLALKRAQNALLLAEDLSAVREAACFLDSSGTPSKDRKIY